MYMYISVGHTVLSVNGITSVGRQMDDEANTDIPEFLANEDNYPVAIKFGRPKLSTNEKIMLAGMFHS